MRKLLRKTAQAASAAAAMMVALADGEVAMALMEEPEVLPARHRTPGFHL